MNFRNIIVSVVAFLLVSSTSVSAVNFTVSDDAELRAAIGAAADGDTITFDSDITLASNLPAVDVSLTIDGDGFALDGAGAYRGFFTFSAAGRKSVVLRNITIRNTLAIGGRGGGSKAYSGGGGGAGLGGAIFVHENIDLSLESVIFDTNSAIGGAGGDDLNLPGGGGTNGNGGGGGLGGAGGDSNLFENSTNGGGGGVGPGANGGGDGVAAGTSNILSGADGGAASSAYSAPAEGGGLNPVGTDGGFGGGGGADNPGNLGGQTGGRGGFGGGGGAAFNGGSGGFGGGAGAGAIAIGANGAAGFGGGYAGSPTGSRGGGGGLGAGGAVFAMAGGTVTITGSGSIANGAVTGGRGGDFGGSMDGFPGSGFGSGIFVQGDGGTVTFSPGDGETQTVADGIADQTGSGGTGGDAGAGGVTVDGQGTLILSGMNTYSGATIVDTGLLLVDGSLINTTFVDVYASGTLGGTGIIEAQVDLSGALVTENDPLTIDELSWFGGAKLVETLGPDFVAPIVTGALTNPSAGSYFIELTDGGVVPGETYTLLTYGSVSGFSAADFTVSGIDGTLALTPNALTFTVAELPDYAVSMQVSKRRNSATFLVRNTGDTTSRFFLSQTRSVKSVGRGQGGGQMGRSLLRFNYTVDGRRSTRTVENGTAAVVLAPGESSRVVATARLRRSSASARKPSSLQRLNIRKYIVRLCLTAVSEQDRSANASRRVVLRIRANR